MNGNKFVKKLLIWNGSSQAINSGVVILVQFWIFFHCFYTLSNWFNKVLPVWSCGISNGQMSSDWILQSSDCPFSSLSHQITHSNRIDCGRSVREDRTGLCGANSDIRIILECFFQLVLSLQDSPSFLLEPKNKKSINDCIEMTYPSLPCLSMLAQVPTMTEPGLDPAMQVVA